MRARFFGPEASTAHVTERLHRELTREFRSATSTSATREGVDRALRRARHARSSWSSTPPRSPRTTGPRRDPQTDFTVNANGTLNLLEATRAPLPRRDRSSSPRPTRSTATRPNLLPLVELETRLELPADHRCYDGIDTTMSIDHSTALAVRRLEGRRRPARAGVRPLLRHADRLLPRRLPDRAPARRRAAARLPRLPDELHGHRARRTRSSATTASRCATTSTAPTSSRAFAAFHARPARRRRLQHRRRPRAATARCSRRSTLCERDRRPRAELGARRRAADRRPPLVDQRPRRRSSADYPDWELRYGIEDILREIHEHNVERWTAAAA